MCVFKMTANAAMLAGLRPSVCVVGCGTYICLHDLYAGKDHCRNCEPYAVAQAEGRNVTCMNRPGVWRIMRLHYTSTRGLQVRLRRPDDGRWVTEDAYNVNLD